jgi:hypothetical protein
VSHEARITGRAPAPGWRCWPGRIRFGVLEELVSGKVRAFSSAIDPDAGVVYEVFGFEPDDTRRDGSTPT